jgi:hypothetical protein
VQQRDGRNPSPLPFRLLSSFHDGRISEIQNTLPGLLRHKLIEGKANADQPVKVRITGPLFYDASHKPCKFNNADTVIEHNSPARKTIWEIHPVDRVQVYVVAKHKWSDLGEWTQ